MKKIVTLIFLFIAIISFGQNSEFKKAQKLVKDKMYTEANILFEKLLNKDFGELDEITQLNCLTTNANCYFALNDYQTAYDKYTLLLKFIESTKIEIPNKDEYVAGVIKFMDNLKSKIPKDSNSTSAVVVTSESNSTTKTETTETKVAETAAPASNDKTVTLTVSGTGTTLEEAKLNALRSAIEQAFGAFISSKTEILNDKVLIDQIISVTNGSVQSFDILNESQFPDGRWGINLKTFVSVSKLSSFMEAKGVAVEIQGSLFALNIKQQLLNEQGEIKAICEMVGMLHEPMQTAFDYKIITGQPKSLDESSKNWGVSIKVNAVANKNMDLCANYCIKTISALSLSDLEVENYKKLRKQIFPVTVSYNGSSITGYLRKQISINALNTLTSHGEFYARCFEVNSFEKNFIENDTVVFKYVDNPKIFDFGKPQELNRNSIYKDNAQLELLKESSMSEYEEVMSNKFVTDKTINFLKEGDLAATFNWEDKINLSQLEKITNYTVKPTRVRSQFKEGGFVVKEENGHGIVVAIADLEDANQSDAVIVCQNLNINGYRDWYLPEVYELKLTFDYYYKLKLGGFILNDFKGTLPGSYWTNYVYPDGRKEGITIDWWYKGKSYVSRLNSKQNVRAFRRF